MMVGHDLRDGRAGHGRDIIHPVSIAGENLARHPEVAHDREFCGRSGNPRDRFEEMVEALARIGDPDEQEAQWPIAWHLLWRWLGSEQGLVIAIGQNPDLGRDLHAAVFADRRRSIFAAHYNRIGQLIFGLIICNRSCQYGPLGFQKPLTITILQRRHCDIVGPRVANRTIQNRGPAKLTRELERRARTAIIAPQGKRPVGAHLLGQLADKPAISQPIDLLGHAVQAGSCRNPLRPFSHAAGANQAWIQRWLTEPTEFAVEPITKSPGQQSLEAIGP